VGFEPPVIPPSDGGVLDAFLRGLLDDGRAVVGVEAAPEPDPACLRRLGQFAAAAGAELAGEAPPTCLDSAGWALRVFYDACRFMVCRDLAEPEVVAALKRPHPRARSESVDWSVDLVFRQLPELFRRARHLSRTDPLVRELHFLAVSWPLSSVGIPDVTGVDLDPFLSHRGLRQLYVDRILRHQDLCRVGDPRVDEALREALGGHPELAPELAAQLVSRGDPSI
jgi:hypothetical protein